MHDSLERYTAMLIFAASTIAGGIGWLLRLGSRVKTNERSISENEKDIAKLAERTDVKFDRVFALMDANNEKHGKTLERFGELAGKLDTISDILRKEQR